MKIPRSVRFHLFPRLQQIALAIARKRKLIHQGVQGARLLLIDV